FFSVVPVLRLANDSAIWIAASASQPTSGPSGLDSVEGLLEVGDEVVGILTAYGEPEQALRDPRRRETAGVVLAMARRRGMRDDRVDAAEARGPETELHGVHQTLAGLAPSANFERERAAKPVELAAGKA